MIARGLVFAVVVIGATGIAHAEPPRIVATIPPLAALAESVAGEGAVALLLSGTASPHGYALRPSQARALRDADIILWVGPHFETFLAKPLETYAQSAQLITAASLSEMRLYARRSGGLWAPHEHDEHDDHDDDAHDEHDEHDEDAYADTDPHIWLDPHNARVIVRALARALMRRDATRSARYKRNAKSAQKALRALDGELRAMLAPVRGRGFIVMHDAYRSFEEAYGLRALGSVRSDDARPPGARRVRALRLALVEGHAVCLFTEPQFSPALALRLVEKTRARTAALDPLGSRLTPGAALYPRLMRALAGTALACLAP